MIMIKIKKNSIRKNPNAGRTSFMAVGPIEIKFKITGKEFPNELRPYALITDWEEARITYQPGDGTQRKIREYVKPGVWQGFILNPDDVKRFQKKFNQTFIEVTTSGGHQIIHSAFPEPKYLFHYEKKSLICSACRTKIPVTNIEVDYTEGGTEFETCPSCGATNSFPEHEYESIEDALTRES